VADRPTRPEAGPSGDEIEITPEMLRAGADKFCDLGDLEIVKAETVAFAIFTAMVRASPSLGSTRLLDRTKCPVK
jgi:hypothetical protein